MIESKWPNLLCYIIMIVPHVLIHLPSILKHNGSSSFIQGFIFLSIFFGLPMAILQRKRDLMSAIIVHFTIDFVRFLIFGFN